MNIRFISSLTPEDEDRLAPAVLKAVSVLLDQFPIAYTLRIETSGANVFQHVGTADGNHDGAERPTVADAMSSVLVRARSAY